jgi:hypothetical protein
MKKQRVLLSDETVELKLQQKATLQYSLELTGPIKSWKAEVIGPWGSEHEGLIGRCSFAATSDNAVKRLKEQLERCGFIGQLEEYRPVVTGRGPHTDLVDHDPLSDSREFSDRVFGPLGREEL